MSKKVSTYYMPTLISNYQGHSLFLLDCTFFFVRFEIVRIRVCPSPLSCNTYVAVHLPLIKLAYRRNTVRVRRRVQKPCREPCAHQKARVSREVDDPLFYVVIAIGSSTLVSSLFTHSRRFPGASYRSRPLLISLG